jgi:hypothetical protein
MQMKRLFRKYHRWLAPILCLPIAMTTLTGMAITITEDWHWNLGLPPSLLLNLHTGALFHLQAIYPILNGLGIMGLLLTGMTMTSLFNQRNSN